jgi:hypothetical protein
LDCNLTCCAADAQAVAHQALLDKILYDIDRAIDLYAMGSQEFGDPEKRASAYGFVIRCLLDAAGYDYKDENLPDSPKWAPITQAIAKVLASMKAELINPDYRDQNWPSNASLFAYANHIYVFAESKGVNATHPDEMAQLQNAMEKIPNLPTTSSFVDIVDVYGATQAIKRILTDEFGVIAFPGTAMYDSITRATWPLRMELCTQLQNEERNWNNLVNSMAPGCIAFQTVHNVITSRLEQTILTISGEPCTDTDLRIPPTLDSTWRAS